MISIKCPLLLNVLVLNFPTKLSIKQPGLSQVVRASVHKNQGFSVFFEKIPNSNSRSLKKRQGLLMETREYIDYIFSENQNYWETTFDKGTI